MLAHSPDDHSDQAGSDESLELLLGLLHRWLEIASDTAESKTGHIHIFSWRMEKE